jgi:hypothetical protein
MADRKRRKDCTGNRARGSRLTRNLILGAIAAFTLAATAVVRAQGGSATDPGVRGISWCVGCPNGVGTFQVGLTPNEVESEPMATTQFTTVATVTNSNVTASGLGPRFNSNSCASCHQQPALGGSSPQSNPLFSVYQLNGAQNSMPFFETQNGPTLIARFPFQSDGVTPNGLVQQLFVITGESAAPNCNIQQPNFAQAASQNNLVFRQPLPTFGDGYIDFIENKDIINNLNSNLQLKTSLGIGGTLNITDDGSVSRFGWKAQWRAILPAIGGEEQLEEGITNEFLPTEIDQTSGCDVNPIPEDPTNYTWYSSSNTPWFFLANAERDAVFVRFLSAPVSATQTQGALGCPGGNLASCTNGQAEFNSIGCVLCHTTSYRTPPGSIPSQGHTLLTLYSDLILHHMGSCLADNITQGAAQGDMFRTPPLWNVGQRIWFMHDARTNNIVQAVEDHADGQQQGACTGVGSYPPSEADAVVNAFNGLANVQGVDGTAQQDLINFLRSL